MRLTMLEQPARWMSSPRCFLGRITLGRITSKGHTSGTLPAQGPSLHLAYQAERLDQLSHVGP